MWQITSDKNNLSLDYIVTLWPSIAAVHLLLADKVYIIEFKFAANTKVKQVTTLSRRVLKQIKDKKYYESYWGSNKRILLLGLSFLNQQLHGRILFF